MHKGSILILVLWSLFFLSTFTLSMGYGMRQRLMLVKHIEDNDRLHLIAKAGINLAVAELKKEDEVNSDDTLKGSWSNNESLFRNIELSDGTFSVSYDYLESETGLEKVKYGVVDEERKININTQNQEAISRIIQRAAGLDSDEAGDLASSIVDWRDEDDTTSPGGAEDYYYKGLTLPYPSRNKDFEVLDELLLVKGVTPDIYQSLLPFITIYGEGRVNINTTDREILTALGLAEETAEKIISFRRGEDAIDGTSDDQVFISYFDIVPDLSQAYSLGPDEISRLSNLVAGNKIGTSSDNFMIRSKAKLKDKDIGTEIICVYQESTRKILYWRQT